MYDDCDTTPRVHSRRTGQQQQKQERRKLRRLDQATKRLCDAGERRLKMLALRPQQAFQDCGNSKNGDATVYSSDSIKADRWRRQDDLRLGKRRTRAPPNDARELATAGVGTSLRRLWGIAVDRLDPRHFLERVTTQGKRTFKNQNEPNQNQYIKKSTNYFLLKNLKNETIWLHVPIYMHVRQLRQRVPTYVRACKKVEVVFIRTTPKKQNKSGLLD